MASDATVGVVGSGPAAEAIEAAVGDADAAVRRIDPADAPGVDVLAAVGKVGTPVFDRVCRSVDREWIAVELGGIGGHAIADVDAAASVLAPDGPCFDCLRTRVAACLEGESEGDARVSRGDARLAGAVAGRALVGFLSGAATAGRVVELPHAERRLLSVPGCDCGSGRDRSIERGGGERPLERAVERAESAIDPRVGIVESIGEVHSFPAPYYLATLGDTSGFSDVRAGPRAAGVAVEWDAAFMKAAGEALERYAAGVYRETAFERAPASALEGAVPPEAFVRPDSGYHDPGPDDRIAWVPGEDLASGDAVYLPAEFVHFPPGEARYAPPITTGLGLGSSPAGAIRSGLYEAVERDATMIAWYSTFEPLGLAVEDEGYRTLARRARAEDLEATALLVTQDVDVPVVAAAVHREGEWPRFAAGSGADLDPGRAARSALAEAIQNWLELGGMGPKAAAEEGSIGRYADFPEAARSFVDADDAVPAESVGPDAVPDGEVELDALVERVVDAGLDAYAARLTPRDVDAVGFEAVRVLVPEAQPLFTGERFFGERARRVPRGLGFRPWLDREPHPYP